MRIFLLVGMLLWGGALWAVQGAYIEDEKVKSIQEQFETAEVPTEAQVMERESWSCSVYGMKSRIRIKKKSGFYMFSKNIAKKSEEVNGFAGMGVPELAESLENTGRQLNGGNSENMEVSQHKNISEQNISEKNISEKKEINNRGSQPIQVYEFNEDGLLGKRRTMLDVVRITSSKALISEISVPTNGEIVSSPSPLIPGDIKALAKPGRTVIAYALCE